MLLTTETAATNEAGGNGKANKSGNKGQNIAQSATGLADSIAGGNGGNIAKSALDLASSIIGRDNLVNEETIVVRDTTAQATEGADEEEDD